MDNSSIEIIDTGLKPYREVLDLQEQLFNANIDARQRGEATKNYLILCEHPPVFTLGKSGKRENILVSDAELKAEFYKVNRGGDVTFHGPGQLVVYPILDLDSLHMGIAQYIFNIEETIIQSLIPYHLKGERIENAAGIWLRNNKDVPHDRKIGAIGVKASRNITMHGLAFNINPDLSYFDKIVPCGLEGKGVTSLQKELKRAVDFVEYKQAFLRSFHYVFNTNTTAEKSNRVKAKN
jgi:lipoyl(octanoyl) transferase